MQGRSKQNGSATREMPWGYLALGGAVLLAALLFVVQSGWLGGDDDAPPTADATATADTALVPLPPTATAASASSSPSAVVSTHPACAQSFRVSAAPDGLLRDDPAYVVWYGEPGSELAVAPMVLAGVSPTMPDTGTYWFADGPQPMLWYGTDAPLSIGATLLDDVDGGADDGTVAVDILEGFIRDESSQHAQLTFPQPGCWELTATAGEMETTIPILVAPVTERPDMLQAVANRATQPYVPPLECPGPAWSGPSDPLSILWAGWWVEAEAAWIGESLALGSDSTVFWAGQVTSFRVRFEDDPSRVFALEAVASDGSRVSAATSRRTPGHAVGSLTFGKPGCWEVSLWEDGLTLMTINVFVYPADCRREVATEPVPNGCTVLAGNP